MDMRSLYLLLLLLLLLLRWLWRLMFGHSSTLQRIASAKSLL